MAVSGWVGKPLLDIASYARKGPGQRIQLTQAEREHIRRTVSRTPEVMVKVLTQGGQNLKAVQRHLHYLSREGEQILHTDDGQSLQGKEAEAQLLKDWDLDLEEHRRSLKLSPTNNRPPPKLVHKLIFSMPPGTPPDKVLVATQNFAREQFGLKHRYALVLHTDEPHPHVHLVLKALSEEGQRLNIKKATLREWRSEFAKHLRRLGVPANATERAVRGARRSLSDGRYRTQQRGVSIAQALSSRHHEQPEGRVNGMSTDVQQGWRVLVERLYALGEKELARRSELFSQSSPRPPKDCEHVLPDRTR